jgi:pyruvate dehydrogenase E1 component beta subunit
MEQSFYHLDGPVIRMGAMDVPIPFSPALEDITVPTPEGVAVNARKLMAGEMFHG